MGDPYPLVGRFRTHPVRAATPSSTQCEEYCYGIYYYSIKHSGAETDTPGRAKKSVSVVKVLYIT